MKGIIRYFTLTPLPESARPEKRVVKFPRTPAGSGSLIRRREQNEDNDNSASQLLFQVRFAKRSGIPARRFCDEGYSECSSLFPSFSWR